MFERISEHTNAVLFVTRCDIKTVFRPRKKTQQHLSVVGLMLGFLAPRWLTDTDGKPVRRRYRAANPGTMCHGHSQHSSNQKPT